MTSGDQGDEQLLDHRPLSKNAPFELGGEGRLSRLQRFERLWFVEEGVAWFVEQRAYGSFAGGREVAVYFWFVPTNRSKKTDEGYVFRRGAGRAVNAGYEAPGVDDRDRSGNSLCVSVETNEPPSGANLPTEGGPMNSLDKRLAAARARVAELSVQALAEQRGAGGVGARILDVREPHEVEAGAIPGSVRIPRGLLELQAPTQLPDLERPVVVVCEAGARSLLAAETLLSLGYRDVRSLAGGMAAWREAGGETHRGGALRPEQHRRYQRHLSLPEVGEQGQRRLLDARVLCVGAGGLGSPCALYLAAAGVGTLGIADPDDVEASNLQRQVLHSTERIGVSKVASAELTLRALNPDVDVVTHHVRVSEENVDEVADGYEVIVDGSDNFETRDVLNRYARRAGVPVVHASIHRFEGHVTSFVPRGPCYRCLFPKIPADEESPSCAEAGVLGVLPGMLGTIQATEVIKILLGIGEPLDGRLLIFDALSLGFSTIQFERDPACVACGSA